MQSIISDGKQRLVPLVLSLACGLLFLPALSVSASAEALNKQAVKKKISGNTVKLFNKRQQAEVFLYFAPGGKVAGVINSKPARKIRQKWSIKKNGALCRFIAAQKKNICRRMEADGNKLRFVKGDGSLAFEATLLPGKQLPADGPQQAMGKGGGGKKPGMVIKKQDQNGDGRLSKQEFKGPPQKFAKIDADKDGFITTKELAAAQARRGGAGPKGGAMANGPDGNGNPPSISDRLAMMDSNGDGKVEPSEWRGKEQIFKRLDRNHDGYITSSEVAELEKKKSQKPLMTLAMQNLRAPERQLERRAHRQDCVYDKKQYRFRHFLITGFAPNCAFGGSILITDLTDREWPTLFEIGMTGNLIWEYDIAKGAGSSLGSLGRKSHPIMDPSRLPNGNTLFGMKEFGIFEVNRAGQTVWKHMDTGISHDVDRLPNGNTIYARGWSDKGADQFREVDSKGKIVWSWTGLDQFKDSIYQPTTNPSLSTPGYEGWIHPNAVTRLADGTTLLSLRNFHRIVFVDRAGTVKKSLLAPNTHDPEILENGNVLVCVPTGIAEYAQNRLVWRWDEAEWKKKAGFGDIWLLRDANRLPNGNTFVTTGNRLLEIDPSGWPVWQLENTRIRAVHDDKSRSFFKTQRIGPDGRGYGG